MATPSTGTSRPGVRVGSASEFSLFFRVRPGHESDLREAVQALQDSPGYRPGDYDLPIATIHEARFVLFDEDTRLLFATSFDGPWDAYMEDFASKPLQLFDSIFRHVEGYEGLPDLAAVKDFILSAQVTAGAYARNYPGTVKEIRKARRVNQAFQQVLDDPRAAEALRHPALEPLLDEAAELSGRCEQPQTNVASHLRAASHGRASSRHHRPVRVPEPRAPGTSGAGAEHAAVRAAHRGVLRRAHLPLPAAATDRGCAGRCHAVHGGRRRDRDRLRVFGPRERTRCERPGARRHVLGTRARRSR